MLHTAYLYKGPTAVRYPRGNGLGVEIQQQLIELEIGKAEILLELNTEHEDGITILAFGSRVQPALESAKQLAPTLDIAIRVINIAFCETTG